MHCTEFVEEASAVVAVHASVTEEAAGDIQYLKQMACVTGVTHIGVRCTATPFSQRASTETAQTHAAKMVIALKSNEV